ncbi:hypothetical protein LINPERHAP2_LOCUS41978 [Linum perenne]
MAMHEDENSNPRCPKIFFTDAEIWGFYKPWSKALVVKVPKKSFSYQRIKRRLEYLWAKAGRILVSDMENAFFLVRFLSDDDYQRVAFGAPWKIYDYYISVSQWSPSFSKDEPIKKILTWVRLPRLPIQYFNQVAVNRIGNYIGKTVHLDMATSKGARTRYARVCVEVDIFKPLLGKYMIDNRTYHVEYESLENICFNCGFYGHKEDRCTPEDSGQAEEIPQPSSVTVEPMTEGDLGTWMTICRRKKRREAGLKVPKESVAASGSRFETLSSLGTSSSEKADVPHTKVSAPSKEPSNVGKKTSIHDEALRKVQEDALAKEKQPSE